MATQLLDTKVSVLSLLYRAGRGSVKSVVYAAQSVLRHPRDFETVVEAGEVIIKALPTWAYSFQIPEGIEAKLHDLHFPSPLTLAAFKDDFGVIGRWLCLGLGGATVKTVMREPRDGNARPRLQEVSIDEFDGLINAMGLPSPGIEGVINQLEASGLFQHNRPIGISVGGSSLEEYKNNFDRLNDYLMQKSPSQKIQFYYEVNISCPNTPDGQQMTKHPELLENLLTHMRGKSYAVIGLKLSPDTPDNGLMAFARLLKKFQKTYMNLGNTTSRTCEEVGLPLDAISVGKGGLSGPALYARTLAMVNVIRSAYTKEELPIIATGGIDSADKVSELLNNGANLVGIATAVGENMYCIPGINRQLAQTP